MRSRDQGRKDLQPAAANDKIVKPITDTAASQLQNPQSPSSYSIIAWDLFKSDHAVSDALKLRIPVGQRLVGYDNGAVSLGKEVFESDDMSPIAEGIAGKQPHF